MHDKITGNPNTYTKCRVFVVEHIHKTLQCHRAVALGITGNTGGLHRSQQARGARCVPSQRPRLAREQACQPPLPSLTAAVAAPQLRQAAPPLRRGHPRQHGMRASCHVSVPRAAPEAKAREARGRALWRRRRRRLHTSTWQRSHRRAGCGSCGQRRLHGAGHEARRATLEIDRSIVGSQPAADRRRAILRHRGSRACTALVE